MNSKKSVKKTKSSPELEKLEKKIEDLKAKSQDLTAQKQKSVTPISADSLDKMTPKQSTNSLADLKKKLNNTKTTKTEPKKDEKAKIVQNVQNQTNLVKMPEITSKVEKQAENKIIEGKLTENEHKEMSRKNPFGDFS